MRHSMALSVAALAVALGIAGTKCAAQNVPPGTYQQTCRDIRVNNETLQARCEDKGRHWRTSELPDFWRCSGDIFNDNGRLGCDTSQVSNWQSGGPSGTYTQSCRDIHRRGGRLEARCETSSGGWNWSYLDNPDRCTSDIVNVNGNLQCQVSQQNWQAGGPAGSYTQSCQDIRRRGDRLEARCQDGSGNWVATALDDVDSCSSDITNQNGQLSCEHRRRRGHYYEGNVPPGSYSQTCRNARISGDTLYAECPNPGGHFKETILPNVSRCTGDIQNRNGKLICSRDDDDR